eukprot:4552343-Prymnesium_polylepis.1
MPKEVDKLMGNFDELDSSDDDEHVSDSDGNGSFNSSGGRSAPPSRAKQGGPSLMDYALLRDLALEMNVDPPIPGAWLNMMGDLADRLPHAMCVVDMRKPGLPITICNTAMTTLTGYSRSEIVGQNCRLLQGQRTEPAAVRDLVTAIRTATPAQVRITNYRADGSRFTNNLLIAPVADATGRPRYFIGVLSDAADEAREGAKLELLRSALPRHLLAESEPQLSKLETESFARHRDDEATLEQYRESMVKFTRIMWSTDWENSLVWLLSTPEGLDAFSTWVNSAPEEKPQLEL